MKKIFVDSILQLFFLTVPFSLFFIFARTPIVRLLFGGERFDWDGTVKTATTLSYFALSLPFHTVFYFITRAFYAAFDTKTPFLVNFLAVLANTLLSLIFIFIFKLPIWSLALSFSISITANVVLLIFLFYEKIAKFNFSKLLKDTSKIYLASFIASYFSYRLMKLLDELVLDTSRTINIFFLLTVVFSAFGSIYLFLSWLLNIEEIYLLTKLLIKVKEIKKKIVELYSDTG